MNADDIDKLADIEGLIERLKEDAIYLITREGFSEIKGLTVDNIRSAAEALTQLTKPAGDVADVVKLLDMTATYLTNCSLVASNQELGYARNCDDSIALLKQLSREKAEQAETIDRQQEELTLLRERVSVLEGERDGLAGKLAAHGSTIHAMVEILRDDDDSDLAIELGEGILPSPPDQEGK